MTRVCGLLVLISASALAQSAEEFALPDFNASDAGVDDATETEVWPVANAPMPDAVATTPTAPPTPTWSRLGGSMAALFTFFTDYFVSAEVTLLYTVVGTPQPSLDAPGEVEGWLAQLGGTSFIGFGGGPLCDGSAFCAARGGGGAAFRVGWARGLPQVSTGLTRTQTMYFGQVDVAFSYFGIESAPLSPGIETPELLTRLRFGLHYTSPTSRVTATGFTIQVAAVAQFIPLSNGTQGVAFGVSGGVGF